MRLKSNLLEKANGFPAADHIVPVDEGGGQCTIDNFRTLCDRCHYRFTSEQHKRKRMRVETPRAKTGHQAKASHDIRSFFKTVSGTK